MPAYGSTTHPSAPETWPSLPLNGSKPNWEAKSCRLSSHVSNSINGMSPYALYLRDPCFSLREVSEQLSRWISETQGGTADSAFGKHKQAQAGASSGLCKLSWHGCPLAHALQAKLSAKSKAKLIRVRAILDILPPAESSTLS